MPSYYPLELVISRNVRNALAPVKGAEITVFGAGPNGEAKPIFQDPAGAAGSEVPQPFYTDDNGFFRVYTTSGRTKVNVKIDQFLTESMEIVIPDDDNISPPIWGEKLPAEKLDGTNKTFVLNQIPMGGRAALFVDGVLWDQVELTSNPVGRQYNVEGPIISTGDPPMTGAIATVMYTPIKV